MIICEVVLKAGEMLFLSAFTLKGWEMYLQFRWSCLDT